MIQIPDGEAIILVKAMIDAINHNAALLRSETIPDQENMEEFHLSLTQLYADIRQQYLEIKPENKKNLTLMEMGLLKKR